MKKWIWDEQGVECARYEDALSRSSLGAGGQIPLPAGNAARRWLSAFSPFGWLTWLKKLPCQGTAYIQWLIHRGVWSFSPNPSIQLSPEELSPRSIAPWGMAEEFVGILPLSVSLCLILHLFFPFNRCWSQAPSICLNYSIHLLYANLHLRACFLGKHFQNHQGIKTCCWWPTDLFDGAVDRLVFRCAIFNSLGIPSLKHRDELRQNWCHYTFPCYITTHKISVENRLYVEHGFFSDKPSSDGLYLSEKSLIDSGDGCTTLNVFNAMNCMPKNGWSGKLNVYIFTTIKKDE